MIWHLAIYDVKPRIVKVEEGTIPSTRQSTYFRRRQFISTCHIPGVLHACRASRNLALRRWKLSFAAGRQPPKIFFDFSCDTLFIPEDFRLGDFAERLNPVDRVKLSKMAISIKDLTSNDYAHNGFDLAWLLVKNFPSLTHLTLQRSIWTQCGQRKLNVVMLSGALENLVLSAVGGNGPSPNLSQ